MRPNMIYYNHILEKNLHLHYMDTDSFILSVNTKDFIKDLLKFKDRFFFSNLDKNHELFSNKNKKVIGKFKIESPKSTWIDEFICLRSKMYAFKCGDDCKNKLKGVSKSYYKNINFDEHKKCLDGSNINKNVTKILFDHSTMKCIFNE